ncbi:GMP synthase-like glutamine amidotransferase [Chromohalobacter marismortui]|uniref:GMP synthase-like glutamine amidotransferase n=1 Tax=Chromohalobacter marismortui TaxID=42055 RepID=A0A4R7NT82_9GAMM|nr:MULTISPECIES: type 1 glutamine amidotransferase [Chromohalobacter]MCI0508992.1 type 1 glutamine amidotransferase [Chromohalobacter sp.]MCI0592903.1 type 1 glutamine amidotransferase [Chromohalobacter sp.]TDU24118.1 GMP synthase-like glutamine amidotransferase [Chromohalobacter marismortui]
MHIYFLQHADYLGPARFADWLTGMGHSHNTCHLYADETLPRFDDLDALIVLDAPFGLHEDAAPMWLKRERKLIVRMLKSGKPLLGVGVGAQLIAEALGAIVSRGTYAERGWQPVTLADESPFDLPERFEAFTWHHDVFGLPDEALPLGGSTASPLQGFAWDGGRVVALQCHLEATAASVSALYDHLDAFGARLKAAEGPYLQPRETVMEEPRRFDRLAALLDRVMLDWLRHGRRP